MCNDNAHGIFLKKLCKNELGFLVWFGAFLVGLFVWGILFACGVLFGFFCLFDWFGWVFLVLQLFTFSPFFLNVMFRLNHDFNSPMNFNTLG